VVWDILKEEKAGEFGSDIHKEGIKSISIGSDGETIVSGGKTGTIAIWNL
jgi:WD40 repeat protein